MEMGKYVGRSPGEPRHNVPTYFTPMNIFLLRQRNMLSLTFLEIIRDSVGLCFIFTAFDSDLSGKKKKTTKNPDNKAFYNKKTTMQSYLYLIFDFSVGKNKRMVVMELK